MKMKKGLFLIFFCISISLSISSRLIDSLQGKLIVKDSCKVYEISTLNELNVTKDIKGLDLIAGQVVLSADKYKEINYKDYSLKLDNSKLQINRINNLFIQCESLQGDSILDFDFISLTLKEFQKIEISYINENKMLLIKNLSDILNCNLFDDRLIMFSNSQIFLHKKEDSNEIIIKVKRGKVILKESEGKEIELSKKETFNKVYKTPKPSLKENPIEKCNYEKTFDNKNCVLQITFPNDNVVLLKRNEKVPDIPNGSKVELIEGFVQISCLKQNVNFYAGECNFNLKECGCLSVSIDPKTKGIDLKQIDNVSMINFGNTQITLQPHQQVRLFLDDFTGVEEIISFKGNITTETIGVKIIIKENSSALILTKSDTRVISIEAKRGELEVISIDGVTSVLNEGDGVSESVGGIGEIKNLGITGILDVPLVPALQVQSKTLKSIDIEHLVQDLPPEPNRPEGTPYQ
jgi:hypothetical protein